MNNRVIGLIVGVLVLSTVGLALNFTSTTHTTRQEKPTKQVTVVKHHTDRSTLTDADVVGVWVNHHNREIHQKITFTADHKWKENQHHVTNIYSGTWKRIGHNQILLAPYNEKIRLYGTGFKMMNVLAYHHILNKQARSRK